MTNEELFAGATSSTPLFDAAAATTAGRVALLRSITSEVTGFSKRRHNTMIDMLVSMCSESFSDGTETKARAGVIGKSIGRSNRTIFRRIGDAESLGLVASDDRFGAIGQQLASEREIVWMRVKDLVRQSQELAAKQRSGAATSVRVMPPCQMSLPHDICHAPMTNDTPYNPDSPDTPDSFKTCAPREPKPIRGSISQDVKDVSQFRSVGTGNRTSTYPARTHVPVAVIEREVAKVFDALGYRGDRGQTIWAAVAAKTAGLIDEASLTRAIGRASGRRDPVAYFRVVLAEGLKVDLPELQELLCGVRVTPSLPGKRPGTRFRDLQDDKASGIRPKLRTMSNDDGQAFTEHRRREVLQELHALATAESSLSHG